MSNRVLKYGSVCSGIEAATVAWHPLGWQPAFFSEIEKFPRAVLAHHYPDVPCHGDFTLITPEQAEGIDLLVGGTPCQSFSVAGLRRGLSDDRGNLALAYVRLAHAIKSLRWAVWENVPGVLSTEDNAFGCFLAGIVGADDPLCIEGGGKWPSAGMVAGPRSRAAWRILDAQYFGLAQRRARLFLVANFGESGDPAKVLFERKSLCGNYPPSREAGQRIADSLTVGANQCSGRPGDFVEIESKVAGTLGARSLLSIGADDAYADHLVAIQGSCINRKPENGPNGPGVDLSGIMFTLTKTDIHAVSSFKNEQRVFEVRRLTPIECERLQGFFDNYTAIPWRNKPSDQCPDAPRYKALGNSMAVPVMNWIGKRIAEQENA